MSGASDKTRFYQEQSVPELQELERKKIFTKVLNPAPRLSFCLTHEILQQEITSIASKRSDFEHKINARGSHPSDYARYAEYEMNLDTLRRKRIKRLGVKTTTYTGPRRIFFVLDRATRKFHGDVGLWMQYISFARKQKSHKKVTEILTRVLRLHPAKAELWIYAAGYAMEERGDMSEARGYLQRALRFCKGDEGLWVEYARLEMICIAKIVGRRRILGLDEGEVERAQRDGEIEGGVMTLPEITAEDINSETRQDHGVDQEALKRLSSSPALSGAIPMAVFDAAMKQFDGNAHLANRFFDMVAGFTNVPCQGQILDHILHRLRTEAPNSPHTLIRFVRQPVLGVDAGSADFPAAFGIVLDRLKIASGQPTDSRTRGALYRHIIEWTLPYLKTEELDPDIRKVLVLTLKKHWSQYQADVAQSPNGKGKEVAAVLDQLEAQGLKHITDPARIWVSSLWPHEFQVASLREKTK